MERPIGPHKPQDAVGECHAPVFRVDHGKKSGLDLAKPHQFGVEAGENALPGKIDRKFGKFELIQGAGV